MAKPRIPPPPPEPERCSVRFNILVSERQKAILDRAARTRGISQAQILRDMICTLPEAME